MGVLAAITSGFAVGIFLRTVLGAGWPVAAFALVLAALAGGAALLVERRGYKLVALGLIFVALGVGRAALGEGAPPPTFAADVRHRVSYEGVVVADPDLRDSTQRVTVRVSKDTESVEVLAVVPRTSEVTVGQHVRVTGTLLPPAPFEGEEGRIFRYDKYLEVEGIRYLLQYGSIRVEREAPWYSVPAALARVKHWFLGGLSAAMPEPYASLAGGIVIGGKSGLGSELKDAFVKSGLVHIIVLSGYNVMIVAEWMMVLLAWFGVRRSRSAAVGALALLLFVGIAGFSASAIRATLMALIALYARATGRTYVAGRALLVVAFLILAWNPPYLAFDPGFALSVAATAGLIWLAPIIEGRLGWVKNALARDALATSLAAQPAVLPLILYMMGNLSPYAVPANLLVLPLMPLAMALAALAGIAGALSSPLLPGLAILLGTPAYALSAYVIAVAKESITLPGATLVLPAFPFIFVLAAYAALAAVAWSKRASITPQSRLAKKASTYFDLSAGR